MNHPGTTIEAGSLTRLVMQAAEAVAARLEQALAPVGMSLAKYEVLRDLARSGESLALGRLAQRRSCVRSNITQLVDRLEADGLVRRVPDPSDRRSVRAELTAEGRERFEQGRRLLADAEERAVGELGDEERAALARLAERLTRCG